MGLDNLDYNALGCEFGSEGRTPVLKEGLATAVGCEERCWEHPAEGCHCEDETSFPLCHSWCYQMCDLECAVDVDGDDVLHFLGRGLEEGNWD